MHDMLLILHSWVRWAAIITGVLATISAASSDGSARGRTGLVFTIALDVQFLLGILLLLTSNAFGNMGETMKDATARFYAVEHPTMMLVAVALAHVGRVVGRKSKAADGGRRKTLLFFALSTLLLSAGTPWPGTHDSRPLFRL